MSGEESSQKLPTIVLIGGQLTLTDGSQVESRQHASDERTAQALQAALTGSVEWWSTVSSIVVPTLDDTEGGFAVIVGRRLLTRPTFDGETRRSVLRKLLRGTVGSVSVMRSRPGEPLPAGYRSLARLHTSRGDDMGSLGVRFDEPTPRWCLVDGNEYYLRLIADYLGARVLIDTTGELLSTCAGVPPDTGTLSIEYRVAAPSHRLQFVVMPDTVRIRERIDARLLGRQSPDARAVDTRAAPVPYVPGEPRNPADFLRFPVVHTECNVSGLLRAGQWDDAAGLEAARMLLLNRFNLKLGLWDLALNPVLRSAVLEPEPQRQVPAQPARAPAHAWKQAEREAQRATGRREDARRAVGQVIAALQHGLTSLGWSVDENGRLSLPLIEPLSNWPGAPEYPLVVLRIEVNKTTVRVVVWQWFYNNLDISDFIDKRREAFAAVALLPASRKDPSCKPLWSTNIGWGNADADWSDTAKAIAQRTNQWVTLLGGFIDSCRKLQHARSTSQGAHRSRFSA